MRGLGAPAGRGRLLGECAELIQGHVTVSGGVDLGEVLGDPRHAPLGLGLGQLAVLIGVGLLEPRFQLLGGLGTISAAELRNELKKLL